MRCAKPSTKGSEFPFKRNKTRIQFVFILFVSIQGFMRMFFFVPRRKKGFESGKIRKCGSKAQKLRTLSSRLRPQDEMNNLSTTFQLFMHINKLKFFLIQALSLPLFCHNCSFACAEKNTFHHKAKQRNSPDVFKTIFFCARRRELSKNLH